MCWCEFFLAYKFVKQMCSLGKNFLKLFLFYHPVQCRIQILNYSNSIFCQHFLKNTKNQECIPVGCVPSLCLVGRDVCPRWCTPPPPPPLWTEFLTHTCENITFPQLRLRTVIKEKFVDRRRGPLNPPLTVTNVLN